MSTYTVEITGEHPRTGEAMWCRHSDYQSYRDAADQSDIVHGRIVCGTGLSDCAAWEYAVASQGFTEDYNSWTAQDDDERAEYETGAAGEPTNAI